MIIQKKKGMFVGNQKGLPVTVIAPTRKQSLEITNELIGASHGTNAKQSWDGKRISSVGEAHS